MYNKEEMVAVSKLVKKFGEYSSKLNENEDKRIVIMKDNKPSMVLVDIDEYEHLYELADLVERLEIAEIIEKRKNHKTISYEEVKKRLNYNE